MSNSKMSANDRLAELVFVKMMMLFDVDRLSILHADNQRIEAVIGWPDQGQAHYDAYEEQQEVVWMYSDLNPDVSLVLEHLKIGGLLRGDRIETSRKVLEGQLTNGFGWDPTRASLAVEDMLKLRVDMVDEGVKSDAFFVHF
jgi:hypothetical protein